jgi:P-type Ca2+ transporter type 2C
MKRKAGPRTIDNSRPTNAFHRLFHNAWLWSALGLSLALHFTVIYVPFLQKAFSTVSLTTADWLRCAAVASSLLWLRELSKLVTWSRRDVAARA